MQQLMTVKEYAVLKAISENTVRRLIQANKIQVERFGRAIRINPCQIDNELSHVDASNYLKNLFNKKSGI